MFAECVIDKGKEGIYMLTLSSAGDKEKLLNKRKANEWNGLGVGYSYIWVW